MQEARQAHLIECDIKAIPFLRVLISYIKDNKLAARIWGGHAHHGNGGLGFSEGGCQPICADVSGSHELQYESH